MVNTVEPPRDRNVDNWHLEALQPFSVKNLTSLNYVNKKYNVSTDLCLCWDFFLYLLANWHN